jgi:hypothetical protein
MLMSATQSVATPAQSAESRLAPNLADELFLDAPKGVGDHIWHSIAPHNTPAAETTIP